MAKVKLEKIILTMLLAATLSVGLLTGCEAKKASLESTDEDWDEEYFYDDHEDEEFYDDTEQEGMPDETIEAAMSGQGALTSFIGEPFYKGKIKNENDALDAIYSVIDDIGGDDTTEFALDATDNTEDGVIYYTFRQVVGNLSVHGAAVKLIVDKNAQAIGLVSSIIPKLKAPPLDLWEIDDKEAESIVKKTWDGEKLKIYSKATEQTLIPVMEGADDYQYVWVVYSDNVFDGDDYKTDAGYTAHYVTYNGEYLYCLGVTDIGNDEALSGSTAEFAFMDMESDVWSGTVKMLNGKEKEIEIPIMKDPATGDEYLGDVKRKILCASQPEFEYEETLTPLVAENGRWDDEAMLTYYNFINVYDLYETTGWVGPDGIGTPSLLLMGAVNEDGTPLDNACYMGKKEGFQEFEFDTATPYGENMDIVGHEFTHCVTGTLMTANLYMNDYGAINEAMSDILGNLTAIMMNEDDIPFTIGEILPDEMQRSMKDPNLHEQPAFVWDKFYVPAASEPTENNDEGGVHTNSSLLNYISYRLNSAGMEPEEEFYFWMNVARAMTPRTDYEQMAELLPWVMKIFGQKDYIRTVEEAIAETGINSKELPDAPAEGLGIVVVELPGNKESDGLDVTASFVELNTGAVFRSWPEAGTDCITIALPEGNYLGNLEVVLPDYEEPVYLAYRNGEWEEMDQEAYEEWSYYTGLDESFSVASGDMFMLDTGNLENLLAGFGR